MTVVVLFSKQSISYYNQNELEMRRIELRAFRMQSEHSTTELHPRREVFKSKSKNMVKTG